VLEIAASDVLYALEAYFWVPWVGAVVVPFGYHTPILTWWKSVQPDSSILPAPCAMWLECGGDVNLSWARKLHFWQNASWQLGEAGRSVFSFLSISLNFLITPNWVKIEFARTGISENDHWTMTSLSAYPPETHGGTVTSWIPLPTPWPSLSGCESYFLSFIPSTLVAWDPGYGLFVNTNSKWCFPPAATTWWDQDHLRTNSLTSFSLGPITCPDAYTTATTIVENQSSTFMACCPRYVEN